MKRLVSILLTAAMLLTLLVGMTFSISAETYSGTWENLTWTFDEDTGELTISGEGEMEKGIYYEFGDFRDRIESVVINEGVMSIAESAFQDCAELTSVTIPNGLTSIGDFAFLNCYNLTNITVDENNTEYKSIDGNLYSKDGKKLIQYAIGKPDERFYVPNGVTAIGDYAFAKSFWVVDIIIPASVGDIGVQAFGFCPSLKYLEVDDNNTEYESIDGNLYSKDGKILLQYLVGKEESSFSIPEGVECIGGSAFASSYTLESVTIPDSVRMINDEAFFDCGVLTSITIPGSVEYIGMDAFSECYSLTSVSIDNGVDSIQPFAFSGCVSLENIIIPESVTLIGDYAFYRCLNMTTVTIGNGVCEIGCEAFSYCESVEKIIYYGTEEEWNGISKGDDWDSNCGTLSRKGKYTLIFNGNEVTKPDGADDVTKPTDSDDADSGTNDDVMSDNKDNIVTPDATTTTAGTTASVTTVTDVTTALDNNNNSNNNISINLGGCSSSITLGAGLAILAVGAAAITVRKKKEDL